MTEPSDVKGNSILRCKIIKDILADKNFEEELISNPLLTRTKRELASRINEYAIRNELWKDTIKVSVVAKNLGFLMGKRVS